VTQHDGSVLRLRKLRTEHDPTNRASAMHHILERRAAGEIVTGLIYVEPEPAALHAHLGTVPQPLNALGDAELCPGVEALERINAALR